MDKDPVTNGSAVAPVDDTLFPLFLKLAGRRVTLVGGGAIATAKAATLADSGANVTVVAPVITPELVELAATRRWTVLSRSFAPADLDQAWLAIAAAPPAVNRAVASAADERRIFIVAVDDPSSASAYGAGVVRRDGVTVAISTAGHAPALAGLLRQGLEELLPDDLGAWLAEAERLRAGWRSEGTAMADRRPRLLRALNDLYRVPGAARG